MPTQVQSNYNLAVGGPDYVWDVGSGAEELNGTYDMMGNLQEWMSPGPAGRPDRRRIRGGTAFHGSFALHSDYRDLYSSPSSEIQTVGFRVATIPEPATVFLFGMGGLLLRGKKKA